MKIWVKITTNENMSYLQCSYNHLHEIDLEDYVAIVVASEIGNAPLEACKAQAIAARTFAISRKVLEGKPISDSAAIAQAFRAKRNNYKNCNEAAQATAGLILTYNGAPISAVYCNSNGGRTYSAEEVWGGYKPYLIARDDPWTRTIGAKKSGHGIGLSQKGAIYAASCGESYKSILDFYYPGASIQKGYVQTPEQQVIESVETHVGRALLILKQGLYL